MNQPNGWTIETAENRIHAYARGDFDLAYTKHAKRRIEERSILISDVIHVLAHGCVVGEPLGGHPRYRETSDQGRNGDVEGYPMTQDKAYRYTECGLPDVWIEGLRNEDDAGEETVSIANVEKPA